MHKVEIDSAEGGLTLTPAAAWAMPCSMQLTRSTRRMVAAEPVEVTYTGSASFNSAVLQSVLVQVETFPTVAEPGRWISSSQEVHSRS